jgi:hypothetical protein
VIEDIEELKEADDDSADVAGDDSDQEDMKRIIG